MADVGSWFPVRIVFTHNPAWLCPASRGAVKDGVDSGKLPGVPSGILSIVTPEGVESQTTPRPPVISMAEVVSSGQHA